LAVKKGLSMSVIFAICSQAELNQGLSWIERFCQATSSRATLVVVGRDRTALIAYATEVAAKQEIFTSVESIDSDIESVIADVRSQNPSLLVMCADHDEDAFQESVFRQSSAPTLWLRCHGDPPTASTHIFHLEPSSKSSADSLCQRLLGLDSELALLSSHEREPLNTESDFRSFVEITKSAQDKRCEPGDLICMDVGRVASDRHRRLGFALMANSTRASVLLYHGGETVIDTWASRFRGWAARVADPMDRQQRVELSLSLQEGSQPNLEFLGLISASSMLAAFGLLQDSAAVIIGAMLIAPLMTPILGAGLSLAHGNRSLFKSSLATIGIGFLGALGASFLFGLLVRFTQGVSHTGEMWARCNPSALDFCVGLVGGIAASYARTRRHLSSALAGAAIAAALVPPISTAGLQLAFGMTQVHDRGTPVVGPLLLVTINVLTIMVGSSFVLYLRGLRSDRPSLNKDRWGLRMFVMLIILVCLAMAAMLK
jgi:uncharacterized hydrophobic protein (TIGR00271 family)